MSCNRQQNDPERPDEESPSPYPVETEGICLVFYRLYQLQPDRVSLKAVYPTDLLEVPASMDLYKLRKVLATEVQESAPFIHAINMQLHQLKPKLNRGVQYANNPPDSLSLDGLTEELDLTKLVQTIRSSRQSPLIVVHLLPADAPIVPPKVPHNVLFEYCGNIPSTLRPVDDLLGLIGDESFSNSFRISCEVYREGDPRWKTVGPQFVTLPINLVRDAGIAGLHSQDIVLFVRERCFQQLQFLNTFVINQHRLGHIFGPPGSGKSITAFYFALDLCLKKRWNVLWVHFSPSCYACLHMKPDGSVLRGSVLSDEALTQYMKTFHDSVDMEATGHAVFIDGLGHDSSIVVTEADRWNMSDPHNRRLVLIYSDGVPKKFNGQEASEGDQATFRQWSWPLKNIERLDRHHE